MTGEHDREDAARRIGQLRTEIRAFVAAEADAGRISVGRQSWMTFDRDFSLRCGERGYIGMTLPRDYGGHGRMPSERYAAIEELLAAGAPLGSHWIADRQSGPQILRNGTENLKRRVLPRIARGECTFGIGMSEPDSGSDLSSIRTRAEKIDGGWQVNGRKVWTTNAHKADFMIVLCRTAPKSENRYDGLSQIVVPLDTPGVTIAPITNIAGEDEFNEVVFDNVVVDDDHLLGRGGDGWKLVTEELALERSGPERILSTFPLLAMLGGAISDGPAGDAAELGRLIARVVATRQLSMKIARSLSRGQPVGAAASMMKEIGTTLEQEIPDVARRLLPVRPSLDGGEIAGAIAMGILTAPSFSLRGGTREILKGITARELGLR